jgi:hypothetical protein
MLSQVMAVLLTLTPGIYEPVVLQNEPLEWRPTSDLKLAAMEMPLVSIQFEPFQDVRSNKQAIGENREKSEPRPVTTDADVGAFVSSHMRGLFDSAGLKTVDGGGAVIIRGEVTRFFARETSTYQSEVAVHLTVVDRSGKALWSGIASGDARRFGRSYKLENYYEVLSDAIVNTVSSMLQSEQFQKALGGGTEARPAG